MNILKPIVQLLPALIPSWNFFDVVAPSPRIQFSLFNESKQKIQEWQEFRPLPEHLSFINMVKHMFWNPTWNESLFLTSYAERILNEDSPHFENEILKRIKRDLTYRSPISNNAIYFQFRILFIQRIKSEMHEEERFLSRIEPLSISERS